MEKQYTNGEITVVWKPDVCIHSAVCFKGLQSVFNPSKRPWVNINGAETEKIVSQVNQCPSKALSFFWNSETADNDSQTTEKETVETPIGAKIEVIPNGPLVVEGKIKIKDAKGDESEKDKIYLCRCGASSKKPYCDGSHKKIGFQDA
jgi:uncharacterized Fe-S cluster protein YjdI